MKKQALLTAAAVSTIIAAGAAQASEITTATVGGVTHTTSATAYSLASELIVSSTAKVTYAKANTSSTLNVTDSNDLPSGSYLVSFKIGGTAGATFATGATAADLTVAFSDPACTATKVVSTSSTSEISFVVTAEAGCTGEGAGIDSFKLAHGISQSALGTVTVAGTITSGGNPIDGGASAAFTLIDSKAGFEVEVSEGADQTAELPDFTTLSGSGVIGNVFVDLSSETTYKNGAGATVATTDIAGTVVTVSGGSFTNVDIEVGGTPAEDDEVSPLVFDLGAGAQDDDVTIADAGGDDAIRNSNYSASVSVELAAAFNDPIEDAGDLASVVREGSNVLVPWVASGTLAGVSQSETVIRISNIGSESTGAVTAELLTSSNNAATGGLFPVDADGIPAGGELVITSGAFETGVFGTDFGRADINLTIEADPENIIIRRFVRNTVNNVLTEVSLGRTSLFGSQGGIEPVN